MVNWDITLFVYGELSKSLLDDVLLDLLYTL